MLKLKRLKINHFRNVASGSELHFDTGTNLILGQNASGKTTLLALISMVCRSAFAEIMEEDFAFEYEFYNEQFEVKAIVSHKNAGIAEKEAILGAETSWDDQYEVTFVDRKSNRTLIIKSKEQLNHQKAVDLIKDRSFIAALLLNNAEWSDLSADLLTSFTHAYRFDESLDGFAAMTGKEFSRDRSLYGPAIPIRTRLLWNEYSIDKAKSQTLTRFIPWQFAHALRSQVSFLNPVKDEAIVLRDTASKLIAKIEQVIDVKSVKITPNIEEQRMSAAISSLDVQGFTFTITRHDGTTIHHDRLSYGQKRMIAFLYYLECNPHVVVADELVNGLHHRWIDACMNEIGDRQAFLTSQNPLLFDYASFTSIDQVCSSFLTCRLQAVKDNECMIWQNISKPEAKLFFEAYEAGIEHVGDILITRGLW